MERLILFTKQHANLRLTYVHDVGKVHEPGCGIGMQSAESVYRASACADIDIVLGDVWIRADNAAVRANRSFGSDVFYNNARGMSGDRPRRTRGAGYVRYVDTCESPCPAGASR